MNILTFILLWGGLSVATSDYGSDYVVECSLIPTDSDQQNFQYLWNKAILHVADKYFFLVLCPILLILQLLLLKVYYDNPILRQRQGALFLFIVIFEVFSNLHLLVTAIYYSVYNVFSQPMPSSFPNFCLANAFIYSFMEVIHLQFLILFPSYMVYILRFTLKPSKKIIRTVFIITFLLAIGAIVLLWWGDLLGLNIFGLCEITFIRQPQLYLIPPIVILVFTIVFLVVGIFAINYFKKHMPNTVGLRYKKYQQNKLLMYYIIGYSFFLISTLIINILELVNCQANNPNPAYLPLITVFNVLRVLQFIYLFFILFNNLQFKKVFKKYIKRLISNKNNQDRSESHRTNFNSENQNFNFQQFFLEIKDEKNEIDLLKMSQVLTIVSGIYIAYKQYYNIKDQYFSIVPKQKKHSVFSSESFFSQERNNPTRKIFYHQKMSIMLDAEIVKDYIVDYSLIPQLGILKCQMIIHAPKIFQQLLENDKLENIFNSFQMHENTKKMFDLVQGKGGRSGQFFFFSYDNKYVLKTISPNEFTFIEANLSYFSEHFKRNPHSLLSKLYGLFTFKGDEMQRTYHLIMMKNILGCRKEQIIRTYDLKGSKYDREVAYEDIEVNQLLHLTLKDVDFIKYEGTLKIKNDLRPIFRQIIEQDTIFLKNLNIIDYSLLVVKVKWEKPPQHPQFWGIYQRMQSVPESTRAYSVYYHIGLIDILQRWDIQKKGEKWWKNLLGKKDISAQQPKKYQTRFVNFVEEITTQQNQIIAEIRDSYYSNKHGENSNHHENHLHPINEKKQCEFKRQSKDSKKEEEEALQFKQIDGERDSKSEPSPQHRKVFKKHYHNNPVIQMQYRSVKQEAFFEETPESPANLHLPGDE